MNEFNRLYTIIMNERKKLIIQYMLHRPWELRHGTFRNVLFKQGGLLSTTPLLLSTC